MLWLPTRTRRVLIRRPGTHDVLNLQMMYRNRAVRKYLGGLMSKSCDAIWANVRATSCSDFQPLVVQSRARRAFLGVSGFREWNHEEHSVEIYCFLRQAWWRSGFGTEVIRELIRQAIKNRSVKHIFGLIDPRNRASIALVQSLGFTLRGTYGVEGRQFGHHVYSLSRHGGLTMRSSRPPGKLFASTNRCRAAAA